jgi:hypothetical protein
VDGGGRLHNRSWDLSSFQMLTEEVRSASPRVWLGKIGKAQGADPSVFADLGREFVRVVAAQVTRGPARRRERTLVAVNLLGSGKGGSGQEKVRLCDGIVPALQDAADETGVDVVLVTWDREAYSAAQRSRRRMIGTRSLSDFWDLGRDPGVPLFDEARRLAEAARRRELVLFIGAGVSAEAGLPAWNDLIEALRREAAIPEDHAPYLARLDLRDQAAVLERRLGPAGLRDTLKSQLAWASKYSLTHALLASLKVTEAVTTNYDTLFEVAAHIGTERLTIIPGEVPEYGRPWLLKLHGSISDADDFVLTREHFLDVPYRRAALLGLLQAMLLTRKMLFVGYSLTDEDFHSVISDVRRVTGGAWKVGTALSLFGNPLFEELWNNDISVVPMGEATPNPDGAATARAARRLQIFLDLVAFEAADTGGFLLGHGFEGELSPGEATLREKLLDLRRSLPSYEEVPSVARIQAFLETFGSGYN